VNLHSWIYEPAWSAAAVLPLRAAEPRGCPSPGIEPASDFNASADFTCTCEFCQGWRAANALQNVDASCLDLAQFDADLRCVNSALGNLPDAIRRLIIALIVGTDDFWTVPDYFR
jgi:hypothetical protein